MRLLLFFLALSRLPWSHAGGQAIKNAEYPLTSTECTLCNKPPEVTKCTNCEKPIRAKNAITARCAGTLTCKPGRILIANNRYVVKDVECSRHSSDGDEHLWVGKTTDDVWIEVENAACFITPIPCIALGSFSSRCPRGFECDTIKMDARQTQIWCKDKERPWWKYVLLPYLREGTSSLWFMGRNKDAYEKIAGNLVCDDKLGAWVGKVGKAEIETSIVTERLICGIEKFNLFGKILIEEYYVTVCLWAIQVCGMILVFAGFCIFRLRRKRSFLRKTKEYLDEMFKAGKEEAKENKDKEVRTKRGLVERWRQVNTYVVEKYRPTVQAYLKKEKKRN